MQKPVLGEECSPSGEKADIDKVTEIEVRLLQKAAKRPMPRSQHPKQHGCVWAEFTVESDLPNELRIGVFKELNKKFTAWIRFSNARKQDDSKGGAHGMAIKLMGVEGEKELKEEDAKTQDFVLFDHPVFFIRNVEDYLVFDKSLEESLEKSPNAPKPIKFLFPSFNPLKWRLHEFFILQALQRKRIDSPLETQYWSATAYKLGSLAVKYFVKPSNRVPSRLPLKGENHLREAMIAYLIEDKKTAYFDFYIQLQSDPSRMPVEDPTIEWRNVKEYKVATIRIPSQKFDSSEQMTFGENLSYTPWHSLPEHKPLGGLNRARKEVYLRTSKLRHRENRVSSQEPTLETFAPELLNQ